MTDVLPAGHNSEVMTAQEVAEWLGVSEKWVYRLSREDRIPTVRIGRCIRFRRSSLAEWFAAQETGIEK